MKKKLLTMVIAAFTLLAGTTTSHAHQTPDDDGIYYLYNPYTGKFLSHKDISSVSSDWGVAYADDFGEPVQLIASGTGYKIKYYDHRDANKTSSWDVYLGGKWWCTAWVKEGSAPTFNLTSLPDGEYTLCSSDWNDNSHFVYTAVKDDANNLRVAANSDDENCPNEGQQHWQFLSLSERNAIVAAKTTATYESIITAAGISSDGFTGDNFLAKLASDYGTTDCTSHIGTATFSGSAGDWTWSQIRGEKNQPAYGVNYCEVFQATGTYSQTISGLTKGIYKVTLQGFERAGSNADCVTFGADGYDNVSSYLEANGNRVQMKSWYSDHVDNANPDNPAQGIALFNSNKYNNEVYAYVGDDEQLTISVVVPKFVLNRWVIFNNFTLHHYSTPASLKTVLQAKMATAKAITGLPTAAASALATAIADNTGTSEDCVYATVDEYDTHINALRDAIELANSIKLAYEAYIELNSRVTAVGITEQTSVYESNATAVTAYNTAIGNADSGVAAATTVAAIETETTALMTALNTFMTTVTIKTGQYFDLTNLIKNPSFASNNANGWTYNVAPNFESYGNAEYFQTAFDINQTLNNMAAGNYELKVKAFNRPGAYSSLTGSEALTSSIYVNDASATIHHICDFAQSTAIGTGRERAYGSTSLYIPDDMQSAAAYFSAGHYENAVMMSLAETGSITFGFRGSKGTNYWTCFDDFRLYYSGNVINLNETDGFTAVSDIENVNVIVTRSMTAHVWNTLVLPFDMAIPSGWEVKEPKSFSEGTLSFGAPEDGIKAGKPYIVKPSETVTSIAPASAVTLKKDLVNTATGTSGDYVTMIGTYTKLSAVPTDSYVIGIKDGESNLYKVNSTVSIKPFRAYFTISGGSGEARIALNFDDNDVTGITLQEIESESENAGMKDGKYLENGKIVIVKNGVKYATNGQIMK